MEPFALRLAPHISFGGLDSPLFKMLVGSADPVDCIDWAADQGFSGVQDPFTVFRSTDEQLRVGEALTRRGLESGSFVYAPPAQAGFAWVSEGNRSQIACLIDAAVQTGIRINSRHMAVLALRAPDRTIGSQKTAFAENLKNMMPRVADAGMTICLEAVHSRRVPGMLLNHLADAHDVVKMVDHPACRLIFDFGHVQAMDGDILHHLDEVWGEVAVIQIADNPGRVEPGTGELNFERLFGELIRRGWSGLCELEHGWSEVSVSAADAYVKRLRSWCCHERSIVE